MKKEELNYYDEFINMSQYAIDISKTFKTFAESYNYENANEHEKKVHDIEHKADNNLHKILNYLVKDFVPPIEREDIISISRSLDDVVDNMDEVIIDLDILAVKSLRPSITKYTSLIEAATCKMKELMDAFKNMKNYDEVKKTVVAINGIEEQGDKLFQESIRELYMEESNAIEVIRWTTIYNRLEECIDSIEHVADYVNEAFMKNA